MVAGVALTGALVAGCGGQRQDANEPSGKFTVDVQTASFPSHQQISQPTKMKIVVRNTSSKTVPDVAVSLLQPKAKTSAQAFSDTSSDPQLASRSRPIWVVNRGPYDGETAYSNTWTRGPLKPNKAATFTWNVTPVKAGDFDIVWQVAAGLNGKAKAVAPGGGPVTGRFHASVSAKPKQATVDAAGNVITSP